MVITCFARYAKRWRSKPGAKTFRKLFTLTFVVMLAILPLYWWIVARVPRRRLLASVYLPIVVLFALIATTPRAVGTFRPSLLPCISFQ